MDLFPTQTHKHDNGEFAAKFSGGTADGTRTHTSVRHQHLKLACLPIPAQPHKKKWEALRTPRERKSPHRLGKGQMKGREGYEQPYGGPGEIRTPVRTSY